MTIAEFWNAQPFSYLATYSFNRGPKLADLHQATTAAIAQTKLELQQAPFRDQRKLEYQLRQLQEDIRISTYNKKLTNNAHALDSTAEHVATVTKDSLLVSQLNNIVKSSVGEAIFFMCLPVYRDAIVFYDDQDKITEVLNICLECLFMETNSGIVVEADVPTYEALQQLLMKLGHPIGIEES